MKFILAFIVFSVSTNTFAWEYSFKGDVLRSFTDNVNLTSAEEITDAYTTIGAYVQTKNETYKIKLRGRLDKYQKQIENDNYATDLSFQYKRTNNNVFTASIFNQVYYGIPVVSTDTTSDNRGARLSSSFSHNFNNATNGYVSLTGTYRKYTKISGRNDKILNAVLGVEHYISENFLISPEFNLQKNISSQAYYSNNSYGPAVLISYNPNDDWELYLNGSYSYSKYNDRSVSSVVRRSTVYETEYQKFFSVDLGADYTCTKNLSLGAKYSNGSNSSNNELQAYQAHIFSLGLSLKF